MIKNAGKLNFNDLIKLSRRLSKIENRTASPRFVPEAFEKNIEEAERVKVDVPDSCSANSNYLRLIDEIGTDLSNKVTMTPVPLDRVPNFPKQEVGMKPQGLWYACGNDWMNWVCGEMPEWIGRYVYTLEIDESKILKIETKEQFEAFSDKYSIKSELTGWGSSDSPDWSKVAEGSASSDLRAYSGIEICPAQYGPTWYGSWDVASGCIWDSTAILGARLIAKQTKEIDRSEYEPDYEEHWGDGPRKGEEFNWEWYGFKEESKPSKEGPVVDERREQVIRDMLQKIDSGSDKPGEKPWSPADRASANMSTGRGYPAYDNPIYYY